MKNILLSALCILGLFSPSLVQAQLSFSLQSSPSDTITYTYTGAGEYSNNITNTSASGSPFTINWHIINSNFPATWLTAGAFGLCDNNICYTNISDALWNNSSRTGSMHTSNSYMHSVPGLFALSLALPNDSVGCYFVTVEASITGAIGSNDSITFVICKPVPSAVPTIRNTESNVVLYPNPARDELNVVYDANADVKNIAVYNIIGKVMTVYKVTNNSSANLNLENIPSGLYFVRLMNSHGGLVATKKFTKQ